MKLHSGQYYNELNLKKYSDEQIKRHDIKLTKKRSEEHYKKVADELLKYINNEGEMICLGTRNNSERDNFSNLLKSKNVKVFSCDIAKLSKADYILDFNSLPDDWNNKWDILFSNAIDHSIDATETFWGWFDIVKINGHLIIGFSKSNYVVNKSDCCSFKKEIVQDFFKQNKKFKLIEIIDCGIDYYLIEKICE